MLYDSIAFVTAAANIYAASNDFRQVSWVEANMDRLGIKHSWLMPLGLLKSAGGIGLLVGIAIPSIGTAAGVGLVVFFLGAIVATVRVGWYSHLPFPIIWLGLAIAALAARII